MSKKSSSKKIKKTSHKSKVSSSKIKYITKTLNVKSKLYLKTNPTLIKILLPSLSLSFITSFMFFLFEPITMYATNPNDFWFDIYDMLGILLPTFFIFFFASSIILSLCYFVSKKIFKKPVLYFVFIICLFLAFLITYIQGNFLSGSLPGISGDPFYWREYKLDSIISILLWVVTLVALIFTLKKGKGPKFFSFIPFLSLAIFLMLSVSLVTTIVTKNAFVNKNTPIATYKNYNLASTNYNLFVILADAIDAREFDKLFKNNKDYQETFKDFTFFTDAMSFYPYTRDSIPYIFNPVPNHNEIPFSDFSQKVLAESKVFAHLKQNNFNMNFFDPHGYMSEETSADFQNISKEAQIDSSIFLKQITRYNLFKYLPFPLKSKPQIENLNFNSTKIAKEEESYSWSNIKNYQKIISNPVKTTDEKVFSFVYLEGGHVPFNMDEDFTPLTDNSGNYYQKITATFKILKAYIDRLKDSKVYNNSAIVILADHGYEVQETTVLKRFNPILYIKGINEKHNKTVRSDRPVASADLQDALIELTQNKQSSELFKDLSYPRTRTVMHYVFTHENHMVEYQSDGKAWDSTKMVKTGNVYDLDQ